MERLDEILEIIREIREDIAYMKRHRNMLCGTPVLEVSEVCDLLKISDRQLRRYCVSAHRVPLRAPSYVLRYRNKPFCRADRYGVPTAEGTEKPDQKPLIHSPMPDKYYLVESGALEHLLRTHFMLTQSTLLFEHLLSHSDRPMFLSARKVCEVLGLDRHQLEQCRKKRMIRARAVNGQMMYDAYELLALTELFYRRKLRKTLSRIPQFEVR